MIAFQGERGSYSEEAAGTTNTKQCGTFTEALESVLDGTADQAIIPIENSTEGSVGEANDAIYDMRKHIHIIRELYHPINHCLIGLGNVSEIDTIYSHPQALGQCRKITSLYKTIPAHDTAGGVRIIKEKNDRSMAGIASRRAAEFYNMNILKYDINDISDNYTRFLLVEQGPHNTSPQPNMKTAITFTLSHKPGSLCDILELLRSTNITRIESRSGRTGSWEYVFFVDFVGELGDLVINSIRQRCRSLDVLGTYPLVTRPHNET